LGILKQCRTRQFVLGGNNPLNGIFAHLTAKCDGNLHDREIVNVTSSNNGNIPRNIAALTGHNYFFSLNAQNQTFTYDFKQMIVAPTHYTIRTHGCSQDGHHIKSWTVEASSDCVQWKIIDRRKNEANLNGPNLIHSFEIATIRRARFIQISMTGSNRAGSHCLGFSTFELFRAVGCINFLIFIFEFTRNLMR
jgi:hypothetical protein